MRRLGALLLFLAPAVLVRAQDVPREATFAIPGATRAEVRGLLDSPAAWRVRVSPEGLVQVGLRPGAGLRLSEVERVAGRVDRSRLAIDGPTVLVFEGASRPEDVAFLVDALGGLEGVAAIALDHPGTIRLDLEDPAAARPVPLDDALLAARALLGPARGSAPVRFVLTDLIWIAPARSAKNLGTP